MFNIHEAIEALKKGNITDEDLNTILKLRDTYFIDIEGKNYSLREIADILSDAKHIGYNRWGGLWLGHDYGGTQ